jgi:hypothetical protein
MSSVVISFVRRAVMCSRGHCEWLIPQLMHIVLLQSKCVTLWKVVDSMDVVEGARSAWFQFEVDRYPSRGKCVRKHQGL